MTAPPPTRPMATLIDPGAVSGALAWRLPPEIAWPQFLKLLRRQGPPRGWLEAAADIPDVRKRPMLLRWIAQHRGAPVHLRVSLIGRLPWLALASISWDPSAHPQARAQSVERLQTLWPGLTIGERRTFAQIAPRQMWPMVWKVRDSGVITAFLQHPKLGLEMLANLIQPPIHASHVDALHRAHISKCSPIARQVISAMDQSLRLPGHGLALGMAAPWMHYLGEEDLRLMGPELKHPLLRRMLEKRMLEKRFG